MNFTNLANKEYPICNGPLSQISSETVVRLDGSSGWENDSTMELLGLTEASTSAGFCKRCFHTVRLPTFDTKKLYGKAATKIRAEYFAKYFPGQLYGETSTNIKIGDAFSGAENENNRFAQISKVLKSFLDKSQIEENTIKILDWGGGDGSVSDQYAAILKYVTNCQVESWVFDNATWQHGDDEKRLSPGTLGIQAPFDIIILSHVIEHTNDPADMIMKIFENLKHGGLLILEAPDERMNIIRALLRRTVTLHYHVAWYSRRSLGKLLNICGFNYCETRYQYHSSYHGAPMTTILAVAQKTSSTTNAEPIYPSALYELFSLAMFAARKVASKILQAIGQ